MKLTGNTVLITGGTSGIGLALAKAFALRDNKVITCGRSNEKLKSVSQDQPNIVGFRCDIANDIERNGLVDFVSEKFPDLNILINNAGIQKNYSFLDSLDFSELIDEEINVNLIAHLKLTSCILPQLVKKSSAGIVNVTSALAFVPKQSAPIYCTTKAAMHNFTKVLRYQLENTPVKVFEIIPALVDTEMTKGRGKGKISPEELADEVLRGIEADKFEIRIEKTKILLALNRVLPSLAEKIIRHG